MIGTPRSEAALRWSPARMPKPPEYCGKAAVTPNSGEKYPIAAGLSPATVWYHRSCVRYAVRSAWIFSARPTNSGSAARSARRCVGTSPSRRSGSCCTRDHVSGSIVSNRSFVG
jgi:hypothetical protein